jgi:hypothetical protein
MPLAPRFPVPSFQASGVVSGRFQSSAPNTSTRPASEAPAALTTPVPPAPSSSDEIDRHDDEAGPRAAFRDPAVTTRFMLSGRAYVTFESQKTGTHFTYRVAANKKAKSFATAPTHFVGVLTRPDTYTYLGCIFEGRRWAHGHKSPIGQDAPSAKAFAWCWRKLMVERCMPETLEVFHEGRCGRCGRRLTTPESVARGLGEECERKMGL